LGDDGTITVPDPDAVPTFGRLSVGRIRDVLADVVDARRAVGDHALEYLDGRELFGPADVDDLPDGLHPNGVGYERMGERFAASAWLAD
jgi:lysophospholipase L1-like esterase